MRTFIATLLILTMALPPLGAQQSPATSSDEARWQAFVAATDQGTLVKVRLKDGTEVKGTIVSYSADAVVIQPRTREPVDEWTIGFAAISSMEKTRSGWSPAVTVLVVVGAVLGGLGLLVYSGCGGKACH